MKINLLSRPWTFLFVPFLVLVLVPLAGCRSAGGQDVAATPARPEVTVRSESATHILEAARQLFFERGYIESASPLPHELVLDRPIEPEAAQRALRVRIRLFQRGDDIWRVTAVSLGVERWSTQLESEAVVPAGFPQMQDFLKSVKRRVEGNDGF